MRIKRKRTPAPTEAVNAVRSGPCHYCGVAVPLADEDTADEWRTCDTCRHSTHVQRVAAMLARTGVETPANDPAVAVALGRVHWRAETHPDIGEPITVRHNPFVGITASGRRGSTLGNTLPLGSGSTVPWAHVDPRALRAEINRARAERATEPARVACTEGPCRGCGVNVAVQWVRYDRSSPSGQQMVLCGECSDDWERAGESFYEGRWETRLCAAALGVRPSMGLGEGYGFRAFHDTPDADPAGYPQRFGYIATEVLDAARRHVWRRFPNQAPPEMRERIRRQDAARARLAALSPQPPAPPPMMVPGHTKHDEARP